ncbi:hypothetical protein MJO28_015413 [Puccinia striiformis f. sp. tritici]|uniref:Uncharacterized protein n=1 Tax=Puccinia striiformis f. sp. tritici TaxID=168172 RepID=A0ACC0DSK5_9BASI|nr:hypothetical protein MJO28_015413 [Puccinia striiformis f. sp. tritici]
MAHVLTYHTADGHVMHILRVVMKSNANNVPEERVQLPTAQWNAIYAKPNKKEVVAEVGNIYKLGIKKMEQTLSNKGGKFKKHLTPLSLGEPKDHEALVEGEEEEPTLSAFAAHDASTISAN